MLCCAADMGNNNRNVGFIIGSEENINSVRRAIPHKSIHMRTIRNNKTQTNILNSLKPYGDVIFICFRINKPEIINRLYERNSRTSKKKIHKLFNYVLIKEIELRISSYLNEHKTSIKELEIEVDEDMRKTLRTVGLRTKEPSIAHSIADIIAWANTRNYRHSAIKEYDIASKIEYKIKHKIRKRI